MNLEKENVKRKKKDANDNFKMWMKKKRVDEKKEG